MGVRLVRVVAASSAVQASGHSAAGRLELFQVRDPDSPWAWVAMALLDAADPQACLRRVVRKLAAAFQVVAVAPPAEVQPAVLPLVVHQEQRVLLDAWAWPQVRVRPLRAPQVSQPGLREQQVQVQSERALPRAREQRERQPAHLARAWELLECLRARAPQEPPAVPLVWQFPVHARAPPLPVVAFDARSSRLLLSIHDRPRLLLRRPPHPSSGAGLSPLHPPGWSSSAFSFRLRQNPPAGQ
jgi:hypothetical protein